MKKMKAFVSLALAAVMTLSLAACGAKSEAPAASAPAASAPAASAPAASAAASTPAKAGSLTAAWRS